MSAERVVEVSLSVADHNALVDMSETERARWLLRLFDGRPHEDPMPCSVGNVWNTTMLVLSDGSYWAFVPAQSWAFENHTQGCVKDAGGVKQEP